MLKISFQVGSYNYGLNDDDSDIDLKIFEYPTFDQLYQGQYIKPKSHMGVGIDEDYEIKDIRELIKQLEKSNPSWIETLFSVNTQVTGGESRTLKVLQCFKDKIAIHNPKALFNTCFGMYIQKRKSLLKGTSGTTHLIERDGYDSKAGLHAFRCLDLIRRVYRFSMDKLENPERYKFIDVYERSLRYKHHLCNTKVSSEEGLINQYDALTDNFIPLDIIKISLKEKDSLIELEDKDYMFMRTIRDGNYSYHEFLELLDEMEAQVLALRETEFYSKEADHTILEYADRLLEQEIFRNLIKETFTIEHIPINILSRMTTTGNLNTEDLILETTAFSPEEQLEYIELIESLTLDESKKLDIMLALQREIYLVPKKVKEETTLHI